MFGFATRADPATGARAVNVTRVTDLIRGFGLVAVLITVALASPRGATGWKPRGASGPGTRRPRWSC